MVSSISASSNSNQTNSDQIGFLIQEALELLGASKKKDSENVEKKLLDLLIQYILANMTGDTNGAIAIMGQIDQVLQKYGTDIEQADRIEGKLKLMENDPAPNQSTDLRYLQNLIGALHQDVTSGDLSNLAGFEIVA